MTVSALAGALGVLDEQLVATAEAAATATMVIRGLNAEATRKISNDSPTGIDGKSGGVTGLDGLRLELKALSDLSRTANDNISRLRDEVTGQSNAGVENAQSALSSSEGKLQYLRDTKAASSAIDAQEKQVEKLRANLEEAQRLQRIAAYEFENSAAYKKAQLEAQKAKEREALAEQELKRAEERQKKLQEESEKAAKAAELEAAKRDEVSEATGKGTQVLTSLSVAAKQIQVETRAITAATTTAAKTATAATDKLNDAMSLLSKGTQDMLDVVSKLEFAIGGGQSISGRDLVNQMLELTQQIATLAPIAGNSRDGALNLQIATQKLDALIAFIRQFNDPSTTQLSGIGLRNEATSGYKTVNGKRVKITKAGSSTNYSSSKSTGTLPK